MTYNILSSFSRFDNCSAINALDNPGHGKSFYVLHVIFHFRFHPVTGLVEDDVAEVGHAGGLIRVVRHSEVLLAVGENSTVFNNGTNYLIHSGSGSFLTRIPPHILMICCSSALLRDGGSNLPAR